MTIQNSLLFGTIAVVLAVLAAPLLQNSATNLAMNGLPAGLDRTLTGSVSRPDTVRTYTISRSVLSAEPIRACEGAVPGSCLPVVTPR